MRKLSLLAFLSVAVLAAGVAQAGDDSRWPTCESWQAMNSAEKRIYTIAYADGVIAASSYADSVDHSYIKKWLRQSQRAEWRPG